MMFGMMGVAHRKGMGAAPAFNPASLFGVSDNGLIIDFRNAANLFTASNGTGALTTSGQTIGYATDLSGKGHHATQATAANRPYWTGVARTLGPELVTNGRMAADTDWTEGTGYGPIASGVCPATAGTASLLSQPITLSAGKTYLVVFNTVRTAGTITAQFTGGTTISGNSRNATGSYVEYLTANTNTTLSFSKDSSFAGSVFNVSVKEILTFVCMGAFFYGSPQTIVTNAINCSASSKATEVFTVKQDSVASGSQNVLLFGQHGSISGSVLAYLATQPYLQLWGTAGAIVNVPTAERGSGLAGRDYCTVNQIDVVGAAIADQVKLRTRGVTPTQTTSGSLNGGTVLANSTFKIGSASFRGWVDCALFINRTLTDTEIANVQTWAMRGKCFGAVLGDSTVAVNSSPLPNANKVSDFIGGLVCGAADISESGAYISTMLGYWNALTAADKATFATVIVMIGQNDCKSRAGGNTATTATVIADYQALVNTIRADVSSACKITVCGLTPSKGWLDAATNPTAAYACWLAMNEAIAGDGSTPITDTNIIRVTSHVAAGNDGSGNLLAIYDHNNDHVHESNEYRIIIAQAIRTGLEGAGVLSIAA